MDAMNHPVRTRFAPSPTGFMHVGNLRTALYAFLLARSRGGVFVLRIEDTDQARFVEGATEVIYQTLRRAGLAHDEGPDVGGAFGPYVQSERRAIYQGQAEQLVASGAAYRCFCDKVEEPDEADAEAQAATGYGGYCRDLDPAVVAANLAAGKPYVVRQKIDKEGSTTFTDLVFGDITIENKVLDDQILLKRDGMPTYNFANVVDDHLMAITHVVRGVEYLSSTPKYNLLYRAFGWEIPQYVHLPLIMGRDADGNAAKLSKRHGSVSFENLLAEGYLPEAIVNYIALLGWSPKNDRELFTLDELVAAFKVEGLNKAPAIFDYGKLQWMNAEYLKAMPPEAFAERARPFSGLAAAGLQAQWPRIASLLQQRVGKLDEIPGKIGFLAAQPAYETEIFHNKKSKSTPGTARAALVELLPQFEAAADWSAETLNGLIGGYAASQGCKVGLPMWAVRIAVSGLPVTPGGPGEIMEILGRDEALRRIRSALDALVHSAPPD